MRGIVEKVCVCVCIRAHVKSDERKASVMCCVVSSPSCDVKQRKVKRRDRVIALELCPLFRALYRMYRNWFK